MDFSLSDHQLLIRDTVREFMATEVRPHVKDWEKSDHFPLDVIKKLGAMGCCGMLMPEEWGGPGLDTISYVLMLEEVARVHAAISTALAVTNSAVQLPLLAFATDAQKTALSETARLRRHHRRLLPHRTRRRLRCRGHPMPRHSRWRHLQTLWHEDVGHKWQRRWSLHRFRQNES